MILVINSGSSSIKFQLFDRDANELLADGLLERIGERGAGLRQRLRRGAGFVEQSFDALEIPDHLAALQQILEQLAGHTGAAGERLSAIGHRVVHGGEGCTAPVLIDEQVVETIRTLIPLAPLHNPANLQGIEMAQRCFPGVPQVAVFDTAFHHSLPEHAYRYPLPAECYAQYGVRRYGFHGISHQSVARAAAAHLGQPPARLNLISLHLGNGASAAAIEGGRCVETSMGMTPLEGLMMGSRCGDIDPAVPLYLARAMQRDTTQIDRLLNEQSGLLGVCGVNDMREVRRRIDAGDAAAQLAFEMYCHRVRKYVGAYCAVLGRVDALLFTAGIGEHDPQLRSRVCEGLAWMGFAIDEQRNRAADGVLTEIQSAASRARVLVVRSDEGREIAAQALQAINATTVVR